MQKKEIYLIVLAAGKGTRLNATDKPKAMYPINGKPMVSFFVDLINQINPQKSIFVVGFHGQPVVDYLGNLGKYEFVWQDNQLGTGHAVLQVKSLLFNKTGVTIVINVDNPFFTKETVNRVVDKLVKEDAVMAISSIEFDPAFAFGRLVSDETGQIKKIVEVKNASQSELTIKQMNAGLYAFDNRWLWQNIEKILIDPISNEYYLTDLVEIADKQGDRVISVPVTYQDEAIGINTKSNLKAAQLVKLQK